MSKTPIIIDCDTGTDDAIALVAALGCDTVDVRAITAVSGNVDIRYTAPNALNLVHYLGFDTPVAKGSANAILRDMNQLRSKPSNAPGGLTTHGQTGLGNVTLPDCGKAFYSKNAVETIYEQAKACNGELVIVAVGPLTNIALALMVYPELKEGLIKKIYFMGGGVKGGNSTQTAEFNILCDPEAARIVLRSGIDMTMVGLDVTEVAAVPDEACDEIRAIGSKAAILTADILDFMRMRRDTFGGEDTLMHDALALAALCVPDVVTCKELFVDVECEGKYTFGNTYAQLNTRLTDEPANCKVALEVDMDVFIPWLIKCVSNCNP